MTPKAINTLVGRLLGLTSPTAAYQVAPFRFLDLPPEIRLLVFDHLFPFNPSERVPFFADPTVHLAPASKRLAVLLVCRRIRDEFRAFALRRIAFHVNWSRMPDEPIQSKYLHARRTRIRASLAHLRATGAFELVTHLTISGRACTAMFARETVSQKGPPITKKPRIFGGGALPNVTHVTLAHRLNTYASEILDLIMDLPRVCVIALVYDSRRNFEAGSVVEARRVVAFNLLAYLSGASDADFFKKKKLENEHLKADFVEPWCFGVGIERYDNAEQLKDEYGQIKHVHIYCDEANVLRGWLTESWHNVCVEGRDRIHNRNRDPFGW